MMQGSASQASPIYGGETPGQKASSGIEGKRKSLGKVHLGQGPAPGGHFRKKIAA